MRTVNLMETWVKDDENRNRHILHYVKKVWNWWGIGCFIVANIVLFGVYWYTPDARLALFGFVMGSATMSLFKPLTKLIKYIPYAEMSDGEEIPYTSVKEPFACKTFEKRWATAEDEPHQEKKDGQ